MFPLFRWNRNYLRLIQKHKGLGNDYIGAEPEYRLVPAIAGAPFVTVGLFWFAWTSYLFELRWIEHDHG